MAKKEQKKPEKPEKPEKLPPTMAKTAEERLDELVDHKSIIRYNHLGRNDDYYDDINGECRNYPDGFEYLLKNSPLSGVLHNQKRSFIVIYNLNIERKYKEKPMP